jgi:hypothetical protein
VVFIYDTSINGFKVRFHCLDSLFPLCSHEYSAEPSCTRLLFTNKVHFRKIWEPAS